MPVAYRVGWVLQERRNAVSSTPTADTPSSRRGRRPAVELAASTDPCWDTHSGPTTSAEPGRDGASAWQAPNKLTHPRMNRPPTNAQVERVGFARISLESGHASQPLPPVPDLPPLNCADAVGSGHES